MVSQMHFTVRQAATTSSRPTWIITAPHHANTSLATERRVSLVTTARRNITTVGGRERRAV